MTITSHQLYVSDLDATLLNNDGHLSEFAHSNLERLLNNGLPFTVASARSQYSMRKLLEGLPLTLPVIEFNGACISDWKTGRHLHTIAIDRSETHPLFEKSCSLGLPPFITTVDGVNDWLYWPEPVNPEIQWLLEDRQRINDPRLRQTSKMSHDFLDEQVICMTCVGHYDQVNELRDWTTETLGTDVVTHFYENNYHKGWYWFTVHPHNASKGTALNWLASHLGITSDDICVFGDNDNDLSMFIEAGHAIAVSNAIESVKLLANDVIPPNTENGVITYLNSIVAPP